MSKILPLLLLLVFSFHSYAQEEAENESDSTSIREGSIFKRHAISVDLLGKSGSIGIAYDLIFYRNSYDFHVNIGAFPIPFYSPLQYTFNASLYYSTYNNTFDVLKGVAFNYIVSYTDNPDRLFLRRTSVGPLIGLQWNFSNRWDVQAMYTPHVYFQKTTPQYIYPDGTSAILTEREFNMVFLLGGINLGYKF